MTRSGRAVLYVGSMEVVSECPLTVGSVLWQSGPKAWTLTLVAKATFALSPGDSPLAPTQEDVQALDLHWDKDPSRSLAIATDLVPFKRRPEVMVVGVAHAPGGKPVGSLVVRVAISSIDKSFEVRGDQHFTRDGKLSEPVKWKRMPLRWERAAGGPDTSNPVGVPTGTEARFDSWGRCPLPNLVPIGTMTVSPHDPIEPVGFAPIAPRWPTRLARLTGLVEGFDPSRWTTTPLPEHFDAAYFNAAPRDQQLSVLDGTESLLLENLHPRHPVLTTRLSPIRPLAAFEWGKGRSLDIGLTCDTLLVDADLGLATLVYRGHIALDHPSRTGRVVVSLEGTHDPRASVPGWIHRVDDVVSTMAAEEGDGGATLPFKMNDEEEMPTLPKRPRPLARPRTGTQQGTEIPQNPALPFRTSAAAAGSATGTLLPFRVPVADLPFRSAEDPDETITVQGAESPFAGGRTPSEAPGLLAQAPTDITPLDPAAQLPKPAARNVGPWGPGPAHATPSREVGHATLRAAPGRVTPSAPGLRPKAPPTFGLPPPVSAPVAPPPIAPPPPVAPIAPVSPASSYPPAAAHPASSPPNAPGRITHAQALHAAARAPFPSVPEARPFIPPPSVFDEPPMPPALYGALAQLPGTHEDTVDGDALVEDLEGSALDPHDAEEIDAEPDPEEPPLVAPPPFVEAPPMLLLPAHLPLDTHPIERCARIAASLAVRPAERAMILRAHGLDEATWSRLDAHWAQILFDEAERQKNAMLKIHDAEYIAQIEAERGPVTVAEYARLVVASERGAGDMVLTSLRIPLEAGMRIRRVWIARIARDMDLGMRVRRALAEERDR